MNVVQGLVVYLIPLLLSVSYFTVGLSNSRGGVPLKAGVPMKASLLFSILAFLLFLAGYGVAGLLEGRMVDYEAWITFIMLMFVGFRITFQGIRRKAEVRVFDIEQSLVMFAMAVALGINNFFAGVAVRFMDIPFFRFSLTLFLLVWALSFSGLRYGNQFSESFSRNIEIAAGAIIMLMAIAIYLGI